ncbi:hypothetical protein BG005_002375 [Podila minutissima]|nr:hypothetical protein BG005_002375 [Podila minutissima]
MTDNIMTPFCLVDGDATIKAFSVKIPSNDTVEDLKKLIIKGDEAPAFRGVAAKDLTLWRVLIPITADDENPIMIKNLTSDKKKLGPATRLSKEFPEKLEEEKIHIVVQRPPPDEKWRERIVQIESDFFAPDSVNYKSLVRFLKADQLIPTTGGVLAGLPFIAPRAGFVEDRPSLLFLDLPKSPET